MRWASTASPWHESARWTSFGALSRRPRTSPSVSPARSIASSAFLAPILPAARLVAGAALAVIALRGLLVVPQGVERDSSGTRTAGTYLMFLGLTMLNPPTVIYFASLAIALPEVSADFASRAAFVLGAFLSSLSWQEVLAVVGAGLAGRLPQRLQRITAVVSSVIILALAARVAFG